ncbi:HNH endonuclease [Porticoccus sp.]
MRKFARKDMTPELLAQLIRYDEDSGELYWRERAAWMFGSETDAQRWNSRYAGLPAGGFILQGALNGIYDRPRSTVQVCGHSYSMDRVIWALVHGEWPEGRIEHIDGKITNTKLSNLRRSDAWQRRVDAQQQEVSFL